MQENKGSPRRKLQRQEERGRKSPGKPRCSSGGGSPLLSAAAPVTSLKTAARLQTECINCPTCIIIQSRASLCVSEPSCTRSTAETMNTNQTPHILRDQMSGIKNWRISCDINTWQRSFCVFCSSAHVCKKNIIYLLLIVLGAQLRNINDSCLQPQKSLGPLNRSNLTLSLVGGGGAVWGDVGRAASTSSPTRTQPDRTHRSTASRRTQEDGRKQEDERGGFHNKSRVLFCFFNDWKQKKPFIDHVGHCPSFTHVCTL